MYDIMEMSVKERLKCFLSYKKIGQKRFAQSINKSDGYVNAIRKSIQPDVVHAIAMQYPDLDTGWLMTGEGEMLKDVPPLDDAPSVVAYDEETYEEAKKLGIALIPEYNIIYHGGDGVSPEPEYLVAHWSIPNAPRGSYIITMAGNSMAPLLMSGAKLLVKPYYYSSALDIPFGDIFAIAVADEWDNISTHIKVLRRHKSKEDTHWIARSVNSEEYDDFEIEVSRVRGLAIVAMDINQRIIL